jgi:hypothetical protein
MSERTIPHEGSPQDAPETLAQRFRLAPTLGIPSPTGDQASTCCGNGGKVQQRSRYSAVLSGVRLHSVSLSEAWQESCRHFASKGSPIGSGLDALPRRPTQACCSSPERLGLSSERLAYCFARR